MKKILFVNACMRPDSRTLSLARSVLSVLDGEVEEVELDRENPAPLDWNAIVSRDRSESLLAYARQFAAADTIVVAAPYWDLAFPALLKIYLEYVTVVGVTFRYTPEGIPQGLCRSSRLIYVTTAGGYLASGGNFGYEYVKALAEGFYGISDVRLVAAQGLDIKGNDPERIMAEAKEQVLVHGL